MSRDGTDTETPHQRPIPRRFAIAAKEVTVEQYQEFVKENPGVRLALDERADTARTRQGRMNRSELV